MEPLEMFRRAPEPSGRDRVVRYLSGLLAWAGARRVVVAVAVVLGGALGGWWLLHAPPPAVEQALPYTPRTSVVPGEMLGSSTTVAVAPVGSSGPSVLVVHVAGAVALPGLVRLGSGSRVDDAVRAAGGALAGADVNALNLAAFLVDGTRVYVPRLGEVVAPGVSADGGSGPALRLDLNTATVEQLDTLPGVGPSLARVIVGYRESQGPFRKVDDLLRVSGIGPSKLQQFRSLVMV